MKKNTKYILKNAFFLFVLALVLNSCATNDCPNCSDTERKSAAKPAEWNIELKSSVVDQCTNSETMSILTDISPTFLSQYNPENRVCGEMPYWEGMSWKEYISKRDLSEMKGVVRVIGLPCNNGTSPVYSIPASNIANITTTANPMLMPPSKFEFSEPCICCDRIRDGWWIFDKLELRLFAGFRNMNDSIVYPSANGPVTYKTAFFNTDRGGSTLVPGFELAGMWSIKAIDPTEKFQIGVHTGLWICDESQFIPIGLNLRYTFNQKPNPYESNCHTPYIFGNIGIPYDFNTGAPINTRYYYSIGAGYDWAVSCGTDFSLDIGLRQMKLPLPAVDCCPNINPADTYIYRLSTLGFLRFGLTF